MHVDQGQAAYRSEQHVAHSVASTLPCRRRTSRAAAENTGVTCKNFARNTVACRYSAACLVGLPGRVLRTAGSGRIPGAVCTMRLYASTMVSSPRLCMIAPGNRARTFAVEMAAE